MKNVLAGGKIPAILIIIAVAFLVTANAFHAPFILDDLTKIVGNPDIRRLGNLPEKLLYPYHEYQVSERNDPSRPLVFLIYTLIYWAQGLNVVAYHLVNAAAHATAGVFAFLLARTIRRDTVAALLVSLFFVVTPIQVGTAIYPYALNDVLAGAFMLASVYYFAVDRAGLSFIGMTLALSCKQSAIVIPALAMLYDFSFRQVRLRRYKWLALLGVAYLTFRFLYFGGLGDFEGNNLQRWQDYASIQPVVIAKYFSMAFFPYKLALDHALTSDAFPIFARIAALILIVVTSISSRNSFGWFWFLICLAPTSSVMPTVDFMVERRVYVACFGLALSLLNVRRRRWLVVYLAALASYSVYRNTKFLNAETAWRSVLDVYPKSARALNTLANLLAESGDLSGAIATYRECILQNSGDYFAITNLGALYADDTPMKDYDQALFYFKRSVEINPKIAETYYNIGRIYQQRNELILAEAMYDAALKLKPTHVPTLNNKAAIMLAHGDPGQAIPWLNQALSLDPNYAPAIKNMRYAQEIYGRR